MKLLVTVGSLTGVSEELVFDVPQPIAYIGVEIEDTSEESKTGRQTIMRIPFYSHEKVIHTICRLYDPNNRVDTVEM